MPRRNRRKTASCEKTSLVLTDDCPLSGLRNDGEAWCSLIWRRGPDSPEMALTLKCRVGLSGVGGM